MTPVAKRAFEAIRELFDPAHSKEGALAPSVELVGVLLNSVIIYANTSGFSLDDIQRLWERSMESVKLSSPAVPKNSQHH